MVSTIISCERPRFILNPSLAELLGKYHHYVINGANLFYPWNYRSFYYLNKKDFNKYLPLVNKETASNFYVLDKDTGETYPIFIEIPCGHCHVCLDRKVNEFVSRCRLESQCYDNLPWFATLTYDNKHLPDGGVSVRDIQLFMKRFRVNLFRRGYFHPIRYACSAEYGHRTHRAHYHIIIWNIQLSKQLDALEVAELLQRSWQNGEVRRPRLIDMNDDKTFYYTAKYMRKPSACPDGKSKPFMLSSRKDGGIGSHFIQTLKTSFQHHPHNELKFRNKWTGSLQSVTLSGYLLNKLLPSFSTAIPSVFRTALRNFSANFEVFKFFNPQLIFLFENTFKTLKRYENCFYFGSLSASDLPLSLYHDDALLYSSLERDRRIIESYSCKYPPEAFEEASKVDKIRRVFLGNPYNFRAITPESVHARAYRSRRTADRHSYAEVL